jgi:hypothetical protein
MLPFTAALAVELGPIRLTDWFLLDTEDIAAALHAARQS